MKKLLSLFIILLLFSCKKEKIVYTALPGYVDTFSLPILQGPPSAPDTITVPPPVVPVVNNNKHIGYHWGGGALFRTKN